MGGSPLSRVSKPKRVGGCIRGVVSPPDLTLSASRGLPGLRPPPASGSKGPKLHSRVGSPRSYFFGAVAETV